MTLSRLILCVLLGVISTDGKAPSKIVGGMDAYEGEFPYQVGLSVGPYFFCGGVIIDSRHILTAAHCLDDINFNPFVDVDVIAGTNNLRSKNAKFYRIKSFIMHPRYSPSQTWINDIAIIRLTTEIKFDSRQKPVKLPTRDTPAGLMCQASGWGDLYHPNGVTPRNLQKLRMKVISNQLCSLYVTDKIADGKICAMNAYGSGLCAGDSGGPLVSNDGVLVGIASYVFPCGIGYPDVFTRIWNYVEWIKKTTRQ